MFWKREVSQLDLAVDRAVRNLNHHEIGSEGYAKTVDQIVVLHKLRETEKSSFVSKDTLAVVGANLLGILMIIKHENVNVITSRAFGLLLKAR